MAKKGSTFNTYSAEFKVEVVKAYLSGEYGSQLSTAKHFGIRSKSQVRKWVSIFNESGQDALYIDNRGKAIGDNKGRPKKLENMTKDQQIAYLKMENDILKKVQALQNR